MPAKEPFQHIFEDFVGQALENSNSCGYKPITHTRDLQSESGSYTGSVDYLALAMMTGKINVQEHKARAAEADLKQKEAAMTSKMGDGTSYLFPHDTSGSSRGPTRNTVETPIIPVDGMIHNSTAE
ncbi:hypothetical protein LIER_11491 [Lithospermum erythrorhizon]|uniref:Uncharacterized protein n=1 Tax=Lithospermum erythrorhizon TaxID=34254 RepID=A0AAV3PNM2_LITER